ncbi:MAG: threonine--tRNA ligase [Microbacteriaceae bacterium]|nr:threonine--tRNA ligase [Microbacteriaceae bacterium]
MFVNGEQADLAKSLTDGDELAPIAVDSVEGLQILRHSVAHITAQAVQDLFEAKLGIGPPIEDGFYYDFLIDNPLTEDDLTKIQKRMKEIVKANQRFVRVSVTEDEARQQMAQEPLKLELLNKRNESLDEGNIEVDAGELTIYENVDPRSGEVKWKDLCRGPHVPNTRIADKGFALTRVSAAYWLGDQNNQSLQRVYGTAWPNAEDLDAYKQRLEEAARRDHRKLGQELDLFSFPSEIGSGLAVFHPKGGIIRQVMEDYSRRKHLEAGYEFVYSPHISKQQLFEISGHLQWYGDGMFPPMQIDAEYDEHGELKKQGQNYYLKPMNCPFHILIYKSRSRSYRELPLRMFEFGSVYRYEKSGVVHGLTRVRGMTQDDAHLFVTQDNLESEIENVLRFVLDLLRDYGLDDFYLELSTRDDGDKFVGDIKDWEVATDTLKRVAEGTGLELVPDPGGAAFYGPKISVQARDAIGRTWQMSTIQLDFNLPERFELEYVGSDGEKHRPIMLHRALFGSIERFFGVLTEHYAGHFPPWLAPVQVVCVPITEGQTQYLEQFAATLKSRGIRVEIDDTDERMQKKIRNHTLAKIPYIVIAGETDADANAVSFRFRDGTQRNGIELETAVDEIVSAVESRKQV